MVFAISLGTGLGVGLDKKQAPSNPLNTSIPSTNTSSPEVKGAILGTSLASLLTSDGDRHLFFQYVNGSLCHMLYSSSSQSWVPRIDFLTPNTVPKNLTSISVWEDIGGGAGNVIIDVFFIDNNNRISTTQYPTAFDAQFLGIIENGTFSVPPNTRLAVAQFPVLTPDNRAVSSVTTNSNLTILKGAIIYFNSPTTNITMINGLYYQGPGTN
jgi:hypothetical protein